MTSPSEPTPVASSAFVAWAKDVATPISIPSTDDSFADLDFMAAAVGDAQVVGLAENAHYLHEWNRFRARLFKHLVATKGFNTSVTNAWGVWEELQELIQWMRDYNKNPERERELRFYCMDGTGNWFHARHAYNAVNTFARQVDSNLASMMAAIEEQIHAIDFDKRDQWETSAWKSLIADTSLIINRIEQTRLAYISASSQDDYDWALRSAEILRDVVLMLAQTELDFDIGFKTFWNVRDVSMAQSLQWILQREGPTAKAVVGAHNTHLQQCGVRVQKATSMGSYLSNRIGRKKIVFIGTASTYSVKGEPPVAHSCAATYDQIGPDCFFLDLRKAPASGPVADWLNTEHLERHNLRYGPITPGKAWDCLLYARRVRIANVALAPSMSIERVSPSPKQFDQLVGRFIVLGFLAAKNTLDIVRQGDQLFANGDQDTSGELFPPYRSEIFEVQDGQFVWNEWPARLAFGRNNNGLATTVTITMPGMGVYYGKREG